MKKTKTVMAALMICLHAQGHCPGICTYAGYDTSIGIDLSSMLLKDGGLYITVSRQTGERWSISGMSGISFRHFRSHEDKDEKAAHDQEFETDIEQSGTEAMQAGVSLGYWPSGAFRGFHVGIGGQIGFRGNRIECIGFIAYRMNIYKGLHMEMSLEEGLTTGIRRHYISAGNIKVRLCCTF